MKASLVLFCLAVLAPFAAAQDRITLTNGDVLTGAIKTLADGKLVLTSPVLGDTTIEFDRIKDISTQQPVELETTSGDRLRRRITGIEGGALTLVGDGVEMPRLPLDDLSRINPPAVEPITWTGSLTLNAGLTAGNTDRRAVGIAVEAVRRSADDRITADGTWDYAEDKTAGDWTLTQRRAGAGLQYDYFLSKRTYVLVTSRVLGDTLADIELRYTAGAGVGRQWVESEAVSFLTEAGLSYFYENYRSATPSDDYLSARVAYTLSLQLSERARLIHGVEAFPSLEDGSDVYLQSDTKLQANLTDSMIAQLQWVWDWDNTPSPGRDRSDHRLLLSVGWTF